MGDLEPISQQKEDENQEKWEFDNIIAVLNDFLVSKINFISLCITSYLYGRTYLHLEDSETKPSKKDFIFSVILVFFSFSVTIKFFAVVSSFYNHPIRILETRREYTTKTYEAVYNFIRDTIGINRAISYCFCSACLVYLLMLICGMIVPLLPITIPYLCCNYIGFMLCFICPKYMEGPSHYKDFFNDLPHPSSSSDSDPSSEIDGSTRFEV